VSSGQPPNKRVQRTRSSPSRHHSPLTRHPLGGLTRRDPGILIRLLARWVPAVMAGWLAAVPLASVESQKPNNHLIYVGSKAALLNTRTPALLSIRERNVIRWTGGASLDFAVEDFPVLVDGTRVTLPPLTGMTANTSKTKWFTGGSGVAHGGSVNPALLPLLGRATDHELVYRYRVRLGSAVAYGFVVIQE
jgi:hypothetical protein